MSGTNSKIKVLIADDHQIVREGLSAMFRGRPEFELVGQAVTGHEVVEMAGELSPDVVVMDVTMPDLNGIDATRQIRASNAGVRVVGLSMHAERQFVTAMLAAGASGYLLKDSPFTELATAIKTAVAGEVHLCPKVASVVVSGYVGRDSSAKPFCGSISPREREVLQLLADGKNTKEMAKLLHISTKTVETHRRQIMEKLDLHSVADLTRYAIREGITVLA